MTRFRASLNVAHEWYITFLTKQYCNALKERRNRRQNVVNKGALRLCRGDCHSILIKIPLIHSVSFQFGGLGALFEGAKSTKAPP